MKKKSYGVVLISILFVWAVVGWTIFNSTPDPQPAVEYRAVCRNLPANAHWTDGSTRKEIPQTEISPNVWTPSPVGTYGTSTGNTECYFVCDGGFERTNGTCKIPPSIIHDPNVGTISIIDGTTTYVLADRNVWATKVYDGTNCTPSSCPQSVAGYVFQRGNNYGFPAAGSWTTAAQAGITTDSLAILWTGSHSTWIIANSRYYDRNETFLRGNSNSTQWPCPAGRHVPTITERRSIFNVLGTIHSNSQIMYQSDYSITNTLKLPPAGVRSFDASAYVVGYVGDYWSSSPFWDNAYRMTFDSSYISSQHDSCRSYGFSVRCLKNS